MICWHEPYAHCGKSHGGELHLIYGRCRSGKRWFWTTSWAIGMDGRPREHCWANSEADAMTDARNAVVRMAGDRPASANIVHGWASARLKEINAEKRRAKPASAAKDANVAEYLYSGHYSIGEYDNDDEWLFYRFQITRRTAKRVFYRRQEQQIEQHGEPIVYNCVKSFSSTDNEIGFVDRQKLEAEGHVTNKGRHWSDYDHHLYASLEGLIASYRCEAPKQPDLAALKDAMKAAHPDKGGSSAAFIEARARYVAARRGHRAL